MLNAKGKLVERKAKRAARPKKEMSEEKKRKILFFGGAGLTVVAVAVIVVVVVNNLVGSSTPCDGGNGTVKVDYEPDGYGDNPADSTVASVFSAEINAKLESDKEYTYDDAVEDYKAAYASTDNASLKLDLAVMYAYFVLDNDGTLEDALVMLMSVEPLLTRINDLMAYHTVMGNIYSDAGDETQADYYYALLAEEEEQVSPTSEELQQMLEEENEE